VCDGLGQNKIVRVGENSGPVLNCLWTKVHEILGQCRRLFILSSVLVRLSMSRFVQKIFTINVKVVEKPNKCKSILAPIFPGGRRRPQLFYSRSLAWPGNDVESRIYIGVGKNGSPVRSSLWTISSWHFGTMQETHCSCQRS